MASLSPLQIALLIVAAVAAVGVVITFIRTRMTFSGYEDITDEVRSLASSLSADLFRDGSDVVVSGTFERHPVVVRFSNEENTPGLNIRMPAPATFQLSVVPAGETVTEGGRIPVKTTDEAFDSRFTTRTDQPTQARMFLNKQATTLLQRLACSKNTFLSFGKGEIELSELIIPAPYPAQHVLDHLKTMAALIASLRHMPGAEAVKLATVQREHHVIGRVAMVVGAVVALVSVFAAVQAPKRPPAEITENTHAGGILPGDAGMIMNAARWHAASPEEMDGSAVAWLRGNGGHASGRVQGDFGGGGTGQDVAYLLVAEDGSRRAVIIADHQNRYDVAFSYLGLVARIPKSSVGAIRWQGPPPQNVLGDGVLLVRNRDDGASGVVLFLTPRGVVSATPANYQEIRFQ